MVRASVVGCMMLVLLGVEACAQKAKPKPFLTLAGEFVTPVDIDKPVNQGSAAIGFSLSSQRLQPGTESRVYLVKVDAEEDLYTGREIIPMTSLLPTPETGTHGSYYRLNVPPGRYAAVAYTESVRAFGKTKDVTLFLFSKDSIKQTDTTVHPGSVAFMGEYELGPDTMVLKDKAIDTVQQHYFSVLWGQPLDEVIEYLHLVGNPAYFGVHTLRLSKGTRDSQAEIRFLNAAELEVQAGWRDRIEQRRGSLR